MCAEAVYTWRIGIESPILWYCEEISQPLPLPISALCLPKLTFHPIHYPKKDYTIDPSTSDGKI